MLVCGSQSAVRAVKRETESKRNFQQKAARALVWAGLAERIAASCAAASVQCTPNDAAFSFSPTCRAGRSKAKEPSTQWSTPAGTRDSSKQEGCVRRQRGCGRSKAEAACGSLTPPWCKPGKVRSRGGGARARGSVL